MYFKTEAPSSLSQGFAPSEAPRRANLESRELSPSTPDTPFPSLLEIRGPHEENVLGAYLKQPRSGI